MTNTSVTRPDGNTCPAYLKTASSPKGGLVVIQEWWGLNDQIKQTADRFRRARLHRNRT